MSRYGLWRESLPFGLKHINGPAFISRSFNLPHINVVPELYFWNLSKSEPSGYRHVKTHEAYIATVGSGMGTLNDAIVTPFDFNDVNISTGSGVSDTRCMTFRLASQDCWQTRVTHMKVWVSNDDDFLIKDYKVGYHHSSQWLPNYTFSWNDCFDKALSTTIPEFQNLYRQDGKLSISASGDADVSAYMYMAVCCSGTVLPGEYNFRIRVSFALDNIYPLRSV